MHRPWSQRLWWWSTTVVVTVGVLMAPALAPEGTILPLCLSGAVIAAAVSGGMASDGVPAHRRLQDAVRNALLTAVGVLAMAAYVVLLGRAALLLVLLAAVTSPPAQGWWRRRFASPRPAVRPVSAVVTAEEPDPSPADMSTAQLLAVWRRSCWDLKGATTARARAQVVARRQDCLDELERRHPEAVQAWLTADARAIENPARFFLPPDPPRAAV